MKRLICTSSFIIILITTGFTQSTIRFSFGYGLPLNSDLIMQEVQQKDFGNSATIKGIYGSFGSGFTINGAYGHTLGGGPFSWELEGTVLFGNKFKSKSHIEGNPIVDVVTSQHSLCVQFTPSLIYSTTWKKLTPYVRIGPTFGLNKIFVDVKETPSFGAELEYRYQYRGGISVGLKTAIGASVPVSRTANFFWEISWISMAYAPKEGWLTDFEADGESQLKYFTDEERTIKLEEEYTLNSNGNEETIETRDRHSMGAIALNIGFNFKLGVPRVRLQP